MDALTLTQIVVQILKCHDSIKNLLRYKKMEVRICYDQSFGEALAVDQLQLFVQ